MNDPTLQGKGLTKLERAARVLRQAILQGDLRPGQKLKQQELAEQLGMSATPVREVLRILEAEGLLVHIPHQGVFVAEASPENTEELTPIRVALEGLAVKLSVPRLSDNDITNLERLVQGMERAWQEMDLAQVRRYNYRFHATIYRASGSEVLCGLIERLWPRFATDLLWMIPGRVERSIEQHRAILETIKNRDATGAANLLAEHITTAGKAIVAFIRRQSAVSPQQIVLTSPSGQ